MAQHYDADPVQAPDPPTLSKIKAGTGWGAAALVAVTTLQGVFPDLQIPEGSGPEETIGRFVAHLIPVLVALVAAWLKTEPTSNLRAYLASKRA